MAKSIRETAEFAEAQGKVLTQILVWMLKRLPPEERRPFIEGVASVVRSWATLATPPATTPARRKGRQ